MNGEYTSLKVARQQHSGRFCIYKCQLIKIEASQFYRRSLNSLSLLVIANRRQDGERGSKGCLEEGDEGGVEGSEQGGQVVCLSSHSSLGCFASRFNVVPSTACLLYLPLPVSCCQSRAVSKLGEMAIRYVFNQIPFYKIPENIFCIYSDDF